MACKHLTTVSKKSVKGWPACKLNRDPYSVFVVAEAECKKTPEDGPCWWWSKVNGDEPDPAFRDLTSGQNVV